MLNNLMFWQALAFSAVVVGLVAVTLWWLYLSPLQSKLAVVSQPSPRFLLAVSVLLALGGIQIVAGGFWDASMHIMTGEVPGGADFLWPPHIMIYSSFVIMLIVAGVALRSTAIPARRAGVNDPRQWVRQNPHVGAVMVAALYGLSSVPGDAIWHALFGIDLTAWSPPHIMIGLAAAAPCFAGAGLVRQLRPRPSNALYADLLMSALSAIGLSVVYMVGVVEWEIPTSRGLLPTSIPVWAYPAVGGTIGFFGLILAKRLIPWRWAATATSVIFYALRIAIMIGLATTDQVIPYLPLVFIAGAFLMDWLPWEKIGSSLWREALMLVAFVLAYIPIAVLVLQARPEFISFGTGDTIAAAAGTLIGGAMVLSLAHWVGGRLGGEATHRQLASARA